MTTYNYQWCDIVRSDKYLRVSELILKTMAVNGCFSLSDVRDLELRDVKLFRIDKSMLAEFFAPNE